MFKNNIKTISIEMTTMDIDINDLEHWIRNELGHSAKDIRKTIYLKTPLFGLDYMAFGDWIVKALARLKKAGLFLCAKEGICMGAGSIVMFENGDVYFEVRYCGDLVTWEKNILKVCEIEQVDYGFIDIAAQEFITSNGTKHEKNQWVFVFVDHLDFCRNYLKKLGKEHLADPVPNKRPKKTTTKIK